MKLVIISGRSGSGKTTALHVLEDLGFYCVDNLPVSLLPELVLQVRDGHLSKVAVGIDARNVPAQLLQFSKVYSDIITAEDDIEIIFLDADDKVLLQRFSETRRKHPLSNPNISLAEAIAEEKRLLEGISTLAALSIDTSFLTLHQLRDLIKKRVGDKVNQGLALLFQSFGFKHGVPTDADFVFDVRCLPNPYWDASLRSLTGIDQAVIEFLTSHTAVNEMVLDITTFLSHWLPKFEENNRSYMTVAIGCTGGQHRSVYVTEALCKHFSNTIKNVQVRHRELK